MRISNHAMSSHVNKGYFVIGSNIVPKVYKRVPFVLFHTEPTKNSYQKIFEIIKRRYT